MMRARQGPREALDSLNKIIRRTYILQGVLCVIDSMALWLAFWHASVGLYFVAGFLTSAACMGAPMFVKAASTRVMALESRRNLLEIMTKLGWK